MRFFAKHLLPVLVGCLPAGAFAADDAGSGRAESQHQEDLAELRRRVSASVPTKEEEKGSALRAKKMKSFPRSISGPSDNAKEKHDEKSFVKALRFRLEEKKRLKNSDSSSSEEDDGNSCSLDLGMLVGPAPAGDCPSQNDVCVHLGALLGYGGEAGEDSPSLSYLDGRKGICVPRSYWDQDGHDNNGFFERHEVREWHHHSNDPFVGYRSHPESGYHGDDGEGEGGEYHRSSADSTVDSTALVGEDYDDEAAQHHRRLNYDCGDYVVTVGTSENSDLEFQTLIMNCVTTDNPQQDCTKVPVQYWDTSDVTGMSKAFEFAVNFNEPLTCWNTSKVTAMNEMFNRAFSFNQDIDFWDVSSVTNFEAMFKGSPSNIHAFNQCIGSWYGKIGDDSDLYEMFKQSTCSGIDTPDPNVGPWCQTNADGCLTPQEICSVGSIFGDLETNCASGVDSAVSGGTENEAQGDAATVAGGDGNAAKGGASTVSGGQNNIVTKFGASVGGGKKNAAKGKFSVVTGGKENTASGEFATVIGGRNNKASGKNSVAMGSGATANKDNSVVINLNEEESVSSTHAGQFLFRGERFTLSIDDTTVEITSDNIGNLDDILNSRRRHRSLVWTEEEGEAMSAVTPCEPGTGNCEKIISHLSEQVAKQNESIAKQDESIAKLNQAVASGKENVANQKGTIAKQKEAIAKLNEAIEKQNEAMESMRATIEAFVAVNSKNNHNQEVF